MRFSPSMLLLAAAVCTFCACGRAPKSSLATSVPSTDNQFYQVDRRQEVEEPVDAEGRRPLDVRGEFGRGVQFSTPSRGFSLLLRARAQVQAFGVASEEDPDTVGFQIRRMRMLFLGHGLRQLVSYYIQLGFSDRGLEGDRPVPLRDAFVSIHIDPAFHVSLGQMKVPFDRQRMMSSSKLQLVERSTVVESLNIDRDIGLQIYGDALGETLRYHLGVFGGDGRNRANTDLGLLYAARVRLAPLGEFDDGVESDLKRTARLRLAFSTAVAFNHHAHRLRGSQGTFIPDGKVDFLHLAAEAVAKYRGLSAAAQFLSREAQTIDSAAEMFFADEIQPASLRGVFGQLGYLFTEKVEAAGRLGLLVPFGVSEELPRRWEATGGLSWYFVGHDLKLQGSYTAEMPEGLNTEHQVRLQTQFFF